jgi:hypothetical protein
VAKRLAESTDEEESASDSLLGYYSLIDDIHSKYRQVLGKKA